MKKTFTKLLWSMAAVLSLSLTIADVQAQNCTTPGPGQTQVDLDLFMQSFGNEVFWELQDNVQATVSSTTAGTYASFNNYPPTTTNHQWCLNDNESYTFIAKDSFGDGWNGGTYQITTPCNGNIVINNGGSSPNQSGTIAGTETFVVNPCLPDDVKFETVITPTNGCDGLHDVEVIVCNQGTNTQTNVPFSVVVDTTTLTGTAGPNGLAPQQCDTVNLGTILLAGSPLGTAYNMDAYTTMAGDMNTGNDSILNDTIIIYANTPLAQTDTNGGMIAGNSTEDFALYFCGIPNQIDSCLVPEVCLNITHDWMSDLDVTLVSPAGTELDLMDGNGGSGDNAHDVCFSEFATTPIQSQTFGILPGDYVPFDNTNFLGTYDGEDPNGEWILRVTDINQNWNGQLDDWTLSFVDLGSTLPWSDTVVCADEFTIDLSKPTLGSWVWSDGSEDSDLDVNTPGKGVYSVTTVDNFGYCTSSTSFTVSMQHSVDLGPDVSFCADKDHTYDLGPSAGSVVWEDASTNLVRTVSTVGTYSATVTDTLGCTTEDTASVLQVFPLPSIDLGADTVEFCEGGFTVLDAGPGFTSYAWNDNSSAMTKIAVTTGTYSVVGTDLNGCTAQDETFVDVHANPSFVLPVPPGIQAPGTQVPLAAPAGYTYLWTWNNQFSTAQTITVTVVEGGTLVTLTVTDDNGCSGTSSGIIESWPLSVDDPTAAEAYSIFPNPNNGTFTIRHKGNDEEVSIEVFDLQGKRVYQQLDMTMTNGMDHQMNLSTLPKGSYMMTLTTESGVRQMKVMIQ